MHRFLLGFCFFLWTLQGNACQTHQGKVRHVTTNRLKLKDLFPHLLPEEANPFLEEAICSFHKTNRSCIALSWADICRLAEQYHLDPLLSGVEEKTIHFHRLLPPGQKIQVARGSIVSLQHRQGCCFFEKTVQAKTSGSVGEIIQIQSGRKTLKAQVISPTTVQLIGVTG